MGSGGGALPIFRNPGSVLMAAICAPIATAANAEDFGDIRTPLQNYGSNAMADSHGGL